MIAHGTRHAPRLVIAAKAALIAGMAGCGGDDDDTESTESTESSAAESTGATVFSPKEEGLAVLALIWAGESAETQAQMRDMSPEARSMLILEGGPQTAPALAALDEADVDAFFEEHCS